MRIQTFLQRRAHWLGIAALLAWCMLYTWPALQAPFIGTDDHYSNLLPIIHYRASILQDHTLPLETALWYGGRAQWQNPLWSFLYLPATAGWLLLPIDWAARVIIIGHFVAAALLARWLAALFLDHEFERVCAALLLIAPISVSLQLGHWEKTLAWPWILLGLRCVLDARWSNVRRGVGAGICLGVVALTGANYYVLYAAILLGGLALAVSGKTFISLAGGSLLGLLHLPGVAFLIGQPRSVATSIGIHSLSLLQIAQVLFIGLADPAYVALEGFSVIGAALLIGVVLYVLWPLARGQVAREARRLMVATLSAILILLLLASGAAYQGHDLLNTFRVPARAMAFVALALVLLVLIGMRATEQTATRRRWRAGLLGLAALQTLAVAWLFRPMGSPHWIEDSGALALARELKTIGAQSVWLNAKPGEMLTAVALNLEGIALPNVYYGDMHQTIPVSGPYCGYSFDYVLVTPEHVNGSRYELYSDITPNPFLGSVAFERLQFVRSAQVLDRVWKVYRVVCPDRP
jgi:hypothetical protein